MDSDTAQLVKHHRYWSFIAMLYSFLGWAFFHTSLFLMGAGVLFHMLVSVPGTTLVIRSARRQSIDGSSVTELNERLAIGLRQTGASCVLLYVFGMVFGAFVLNGSLTLLGLVAAFAVFAPWARLPFLRIHLFISCMSTMGGVASVLAIVHRLIDPMFLALAAWVFWMCACSALLLKAEQMQRFKRKSKATQEAVESGPLPTHSLG